MLNWGSSPWAFGCARVSDMQTGSVMQVHKEMGGTTHNNSAHYLFWDNHQGIDRSLVNTILILV